LRFKVNVLTSTFKPSRWLSADTFQAFALDYLVLGNGFLERRDSRSNLLLELRHSLGKYTARRSWTLFLSMRTMRASCEFPRGKVFHLRRPDLHQRGLQPSAVPGSAAVGLPE
jgi:hypothetical protein